MNNAASRIMTTAGRVSAPPKRQRVTPSDSSSDFLQTVKKAAASKNQRKDPLTLSDQNQASPDEDKKADLSQDVSKDTPKTQTDQNDKDSSASKEPAAAESAGLLSNQMQAQTQNQAEPQTFSPLASAAAAAAEISASQLSSAHPVQPQAQAFVQTQELPVAGMAANLQNAKGKDFESNEASSNRQAGVPLKMEPLAVARSFVEKVVADGNAQPSDKTAASQKPEPFTGLTADALQTGKAASESQEGKTPALPADSLQKTEEASDKTSENRGDSSLQGTVPLQDEAKASDLVKIKVGEGSLNPQSKQFPQDVAKTVLRYSQGGRNEFDIQLTPKELGTIHIQLVFDKGTASVLMNCADPKTQNLLSLNTEQIRSIVQGETGLHTTVQVKEDPSSQNGRQDFDGRGENPQRDAQRQEQQQRRNQLEQELFSQQFRMEFQRTGVAGAAF